MIIRFFINIIKKILRWDQRRFQKINDGLNLQLDFDRNKTALKILGDIFIEREYAHYFPFYEKVTIIDVGAHFGYFTLFAKMNTHSDSQIYAYEPSPENFSTLQKNLSQHQSSQLRLFPLGVGSKPCKQNIYGGLGHNHSTITTNPKKEIIGQTEVITLAQIFEQNNIEQIDFLKLDCEGAEYEILLTASKEVLQKIKTISLEFHDLREHGFRPGQLIEQLKKHHFEIVKYEFDTDYSFSNLNFGKIVATKS